MASLRLPLVVTADLGATHLRIAVDDGRADPEIIIARTADLVRAGHQGIVAAVATRLAAAIPAGTRPEAVGLAVAAAVGRDGSILAERPFGLPAGPSLRDVVGQVVGTPVVVANDADCAVVAEQRFGAGRGHRNVALVALGTNIGTGFIVDGRLLRGGRGAAGEAGLLLVPARTIGPETRPEEPRRVSASGFGRGRTSAPEGYAWLEDLAGGGALARSAGTSHAVDAVRRGRRRAIRAIERTVEGLAVLVADVVAVLDPELVVLSGAIVDEEPTLVARVGRRARVLAPSEPIVVSGQLGSRAALVGAAALARDAADQVDREFRAPPREEVPA